MNKAGVIGCRPVGAYHAQGIVGSQQAQLAAACDFDPKTLDDFIQQWPDETIAGYKNHREMLANEKLDIVTVATSDHRHADLVVDAAEAGVKGIFCEKPLATTLADADRMIAACTANGTLLSKELIAEGAIGPVQYVIATLTGPRAMLFRNGTHLLDAVCYFADAQPAWVVADLEPGYENYTEYRGDGGHDPATEPAANAYIHFENGVKGFYIGGSKNTTPFMPQAEIVGATGRIVLASEKQGILYQGETSSAIEVPELMVHGIVAGMQELINAVAEGGELVSPGRAGHTVVELLLGILQSQQQGNTPVKFPMPRD
jgi:predicted dehydrogenase